MTHDRDWVLICDLVAARLSLCLGHVDKFKYPTEDANRLSACEQWKSQPQYVSSTKEACLHPGVFVIWAADWRGMTGFRGGLAVVYCHWLVVWKVICISFPTTCKLLWKVKNLWQGTALEMPDIKLTYASCHTRVLCTHSIPSFLCFWGNCTHWF